MGRWVEHLTWEGYLMPCLVCVPVCIALSWRPRHGQGPLKGKRPWEAQVQAFLSRLGLSAASQCSTESSALPSGLRVDCRRAIYPTLLLPGVFVPSWPQSGLPSEVCGNSTSHRCLLPPLEEKGWQSAWGGHLGHGDSEKQL